MKTEDTDPGLGPMHDGPTEPGPPPVTATDPGPPDADSLLENLGGAPLPTPGVKATDGHVAAAYAAGAHKPPRAQKTAPPEPAVVVEKTTPPAVVKAAEVTTVPGVAAAGAPRAMSEEERAERRAPTMPGERLRPPPAREEVPAVPMRSGMGARSLAVALVGVLILAGSVVLVLSRGPTSAGAPAVGAASAVSAVSAPVLPSPGVVETTAATKPTAQPSANAPNDPAAPSASSSAIPAAAASPAHVPSARAPRPAPRGSSNVVEPERTF